MLQKIENHLEDSRQKLRSKSEIALKSLLQQFHINFNTDSNVYSELRFGITRSKEIDIITP